MCKPFIEDSNEKHFFLIYDLVVHLHVYTTQSAEIVKCVTTG